MQVNTSEEHTTWALPQVQLAEGSKTLRQEDRVESPTSTETKALEASTQL